MKNKFIIHCTTNWCGMDTEYRALANKEGELDELAQQLAYENYQSYDTGLEVLEEEGYDIELMSEEQLEEAWENIDESLYYDYTIEPFEGSEEEWEEIGGEIYE